jgi:hypothetical protein
MEEEDGIARACLRGMMRDGIAMAVTAGLRWRVRWITLKRNLAE